MGDVEIKERGCGKADLDHSEATTLEAAGKSTVEEWRAPAVVVTDHDVLFAFTDEKGPEGFPDREGDLFGQLFSRDAANVIFSENVGWDHLNPVRRSEY